MKKFIKILNALWYELASLSLIMFAVTDFQKIELMLFTLLFTIFGIIENLKPKQDN